jgi:hypothetical protein
MKIRGGQLLVRALQEKGVTQVFTSETGTDLIILTMSVF